MSRHTEDVNDLLGLGFNRNDALEIADTRILNKLIKDEDEEYLEQEEITEESDEELDEYNDDTPSDYEYDEDEEDELSFDDEGLKFLSDDDEDF
jgi:hypothetical protein